MIDTVEITCSSCQFHWTRSGGASFYERQCLESRPCPRCDACTLCVRTPKLPRRLRIQEQRAQHAA